VTPVLQPDQFQNTEANRKDGLFKMSHKNFGTRLDLQMGNGDKAKISAHRQMNEEMVNSRGEKFKPRFST